MQTVAIADAKMSDLVSFFNTHTIRLLDGKPVKKFENLEKARKRVYNLVEMLGVEFDKTAPETVPPTGMIFVGELVDEETGAKIELEACDVKPVSDMKINGHDDSGEEEEEDGPTVNSFGSMGATMGAMGEKHETPPVRSSAGRAANSLGVALSWTVPDVRVRRLTRDSVTVTVGGVSHDFKSAHDGFRFFRRPESKMIRFRRELKANRVETFKHTDGKDYVFQIVEKEIGDDSEE
jgi:hypothetical protein